MYENLFDIALNTNDFFFTFTLITTLKFLLCIFLYASEKKPRSSMVTQKNIAWLILFPLHRPACFRYKAGPLSIYQEGRLPLYFFPSTTTRLVTTGNSLVVTRTRYMPL